MTDKPKMRIQSITMDGSRVTDIEVVPVDAITGTQRCEPPEHLRGVDGWHWVETQAGQIRFCRRWWKARGEWCWANMDDRTLRGFRYLAPAAPPDVVRALVEALEKADQFITNGIELGYIRMPRPGTPDSAIKTPGIVRDALARAKEAGL